ncbi:MAG: flagellar hook assembly protein FlgD, partial [Pseudomonadota bacterium]
MDVVNTVSNNTTPTFSTSSSNSNTVDYDAFLQLLVAQLNNQDPTEPTDNAELMSQLASFSSVEQQIQTNDRLDELIRSNVLGDATSLIGKAVASADGETAGIVKSVVLATDGIFVELEDGTQIPVLPGTKIADDLTEFSRDTSQEIESTGETAENAGVSNAATNPFGLF